MDDLAEVKASVDAAAEKYEEALAVSNKLTSELHEERHWRRMAAWAAVALAFVVLVGSGLNFFLLLRVDDSVANSRTTQRENHQVLLTIQAATGPDAQRNSAKAVQAIIAQVVDQTDCNTRDDIAVALHEAFPTVSVSLPATVSCPAYAP